MTGIILPQQYVAIVTIPIKLKDLLQLGGGSLLSKYKDSLFLLLSSVYNNLEWLPFRFVQTPKNYWEDVNNQGKFVEWAAKVLNISDLSGWYSVSQEVVIRYHYW
jgi:hypothetical protein